MEGRGRRSLGEPLQKLLVLLDDRAATLTDPRTQLVPLDVLPSSKHQCLLDGAVLGRSYILQGGCQVIGEFYRARHTKTVLLPYGSAPEIERQPPPASLHQRARGDPSTERQRSRSRPEHKPHSDTCSPRPVHPRARPCQLVLARPIVPTSSPPGDARRSPMSEAVAESWGSGGSAPKQKCEEARSAPSADTGPTSERVDGNRTRTVSVGTCLIVPAAGQSGPKWPGVASCGPPQWPGGTSPGRAELDLRGGVYGLQDRSYGR